MLKFSIEFRPPTPAEKTLIIGTLGPSGTSSDYASSYIVQQLEAENLTGEIQCADLSKQEADLRKITARSLTAT